MKYQHILVLVLREKAILREAINDIYSGTMSSSSFEAPSRICTVTFL